VFENIDNINVEIPTNILNFQIKDFIDSIVTNSIEFSTDSWWKYYGLLKKYTQNNKLEQISVNTNLHTLNLGKWVLSQQRREKMLSQNQKTYLENIPNWVWLNNSDKNYSKNDLEQYIKRKHQEKFAYINRFAVSKLLSVHDGNKNFRVRDYDYWYTLKSSDLLNIDKENGYIVLGFKDNNQFFIIPHIFIKSMNQQDGKSWEQIMSEGRLDLYIKQVFNSYNFKIHFSKGIVDDPYINITEFKYSMDN